MRLPRFQYVEPRSIKEAADFLNDHGLESKIIAGGTDLLPSMKQQIFRPKYLLNLCSLPDLDRMEFEEGTGLRMGALVRLRTLETDRLIREQYPVIAQAAEAVGSVQLRHMGTIGGNLSLDTRCTYYNQSNFWRSCRPKCIKMGGDICNAIGGGKKCFAIFSGDLAPALIACQAKIRLVSSSGERVLPLGELYTGNGAKPLATKPEEFLASIEVPAPEKNAYTAYLKYRIRKSIDFPLVSVASVLVMDKNKLCREARVVISAVGSRPEEVTAVRDLVSGKKLDGTLIGEAGELAFKMARPVANTASTPSYRKKMVKILVERALKQAAERAA